MPVHQQHRELVGGQRMQRRTRSLRPPREMPAREPFEAQPEALSVVDQKFDGGRAAVAKQKDGAGERVTVEAVAAQRGKGINTFAEIYRIVSEHDVELWRELNHHLFTSAADSGTRLQSVAGLVRIDEWSSARHQHARRVNVKTSHLRRRARDALRRVETEATPNQRHPV